MKGKQVLASGMQVLAFSSVWGGRYVGVNVSGEDGRGSRCVRVYQAGY
jgi:hypothetical protein